MLAVEGPTFVLHENHKLNLPVEIVGDRKRVVHILKCEVSMPRNGGSNSFFKYLYYLEIATALRIAFADIGFVDIGYIGEVYSEFEDMNLDSWAVDF